MRDDTYSRVRDILEQARQVHRSLVETYEAGAKRAEDEQARELLELMARHEKKLEDSLARFEEEEEERVRDTWLQYVPGSDVSTRLEELDITPAVTTEQLVEKARRIDEALLGAYDHLAELSSIPSVSTHFRELASMVKAKQKLYAKAMTLE